MTTPSQNQGEGNIEAARRYDQAQQQFVDSGRVAKAAAEAAPANEADAQEMQAAEAAGKARAKGEDPDVAAGSGGSQAPR